MNSALTAATIVRALERQRFQNDMSALAQLDTTHSDAVRAALAAVPRKARIDVRLLLSTVRREVAERAARRPPANAYRYEVALLSDRELLARLETPAVRADKLDMLRQERAWREAEYGAVVADDEQPDADIDDPGELPPPQRRPSIPRVPSRRSKRPGSGARAPAPARSRPQAQPPRPTYFGARLLGPGADDPRPYGCPADADWDRWRRASGGARPAWVIEEGEDEEELDGVAA